jgi:hypothetical protein
VDGTGAAYVGGYTASSDFPTTPGAYDQTLGGPLPDAFVARVAPDGSALVFSTYLGGADAEYGNAVAVGSDGSVYVAGETESGDFPTTPGAFDATFNDFVDAFVARLSSSGGALLYSTYLGGRGLDQGFALAVDAAGTAHLAGMTVSPDFPTTPGAFDTTCNGVSLCSQDAFYAKLDPAGAALLYGTYLGGGSEESARGIALDPTGAAYVTGYTASADFPTTADAYDRTCGGCGRTTFRSDAFVTRLNPLGSLSVSQTDALRFAPNTVVAAVGQVVVWTNVGSRATHTSTSEAGLWDSGSLAPGASFAFRFTQPGTFLYRCTFHAAQGMVGSVVVQPLNSNTSFETDANGDGTPDGWLRLNLNSGDTLVNDPNTGARAFLLNGSAATKALYQQVNLSGTAGQRLTVSGWSKASGASGSGGFYGLVVRFRHSDGTTTQQGIPFRRSTHDWERAAATLTAPKPFTSVLVGVAYQNQTGTATFDDVTLTVP